MTHLPDPDRLTLVLTLVVLGLVALLVIWLLVGWFAWVIVK